VILGVNTVKNITLGASVIKALRTIPALLWPCGAVLDPQLAVASAQKWWRSA